MNGAGLILGRSPNLFIGAFAALFNVVVLVSGQLGYPVTGEIVAAVNVAFGSVIALVANNATIQIAAGNAAQSRISE